MYGREAAGSGISSSANNLLNLLKSVVPFAALFPRAKHDPVESERNVRSPEALGGTHPAREAGGILCNKSHVRAFVYTKGTQVTSGNATLQIKAYYVIFNTRKNHKSECLGQWLTSATNTDTNTQRHVHM